MTRYELVKLFEEKLDYVVCRGDAVPVTHHYLVRNNPLRQVSPIIT